MTKNAVVFCSDGNGVPFASMAAARIAALNPDRAFDILIAVAEETPKPLPPALADLGIQILPVQLPQSYKDFVRRDGLFLPEATFLRLYLPELLQDRYARLFYMDIDVLPLGGDVDQLFGVDIAPFAIAAVRDVQQWSHLGKAVFEYAANGLDPRPYFNSGVMLIDILDWHRQKVLDRIKARAGERPVLNTHDQGLLNLAFDGQWAELHPAWNWQQTRNYHVLHRLVQPYVLHFAGREKPWNTDGGQNSQDPQVVAAYISHLAQFFPDRPRPLSAPKPIDRPLRELWRNAQEYLLIRKYLARFPDPYTTVTP